MVFLRTERKADNDGKKGGFFRFFYRRAKQHAASKVTEDGGSTATPETSLAASAEAESLKGSLLAYVERLRSRQSPASFFHERGEVIFKEAPMNIVGFTDELERLYKSFPDFYVHYEDVQVLGPDSISTVLRVEGTHTGAPYGFGPFPEIEPKGTKVKLDPE